MDIDIDLSDFWEKYQIKEFDKAIDKAREIVRQSIRRAEEANARVQTWNKDEEIQRLNAMLSEFRGRTFAFSEMDMPKVEEFQLKHREMNSHKIKKPFHVISYEFTPTEIGMCATVKCSCGEHLNFFT